MGCGQGPGFPSWQAWTLRERWAVSRRQLLFPEAVSLWEPRAIIYSPVAVPKTFQLQVAQKSQINLPGALLWDGLSSLFNCSPKPQAPIQTPHQALGPPPTTPTSFPVSRERDTQVGLGTNRCLVHTFPSFLPNTPPPAPIKGSSLPRQGELRRKRKPFGVPITFYCWLTPRCQL